MATVSSISPTIGPDEGGTQVTITGSGFSGGTPPDVRFGGVRAQDVVVQSDTEITCTVPMSISVSPGTVPASSSVEVTITGAEFSSGDGFSVGGVTATGVTVVDDTTLTGTVATGSDEGKADVVVTRGSDTFTYVDGIELSNVFPMSFWENRWGTNIGALEVLVVDASGNVLSTAWQDSGGLGDNTWVERAFDYLNPGSTHRVVWHMVVSGDNFEADYAVDNITLNGVNYSFDTDNDNFLTSSGINAGDSVTAFNNSVAVPTATDAVEGRWNRETGSTVSSGTGPSAAQNGTHYVYTESSSPNAVDGMNFWLFSPEITP